MNRNKILTFVSFLLVSVLLSTTLMAADGRSTDESSGDAFTLASSGIAFAEVYCSEAADLLARANIRSLLYVENETVEGISRYACAEVVASNLTRVDEYPPIKSLATAWIGNNEVSYDYWNAD